jgi:formylglycine-generating enzyme required for sulfatase activity
MRTIRGSHRGLFLPIVGLMAGCELVADIGDPKLRQPDGGTGGQAGHGGTTTSSSTSSSTTSSSTSTGTGGAMPTCTDGVKNGNETGKDCGGGGTCPACPDGQGCIVGTDCMSVACSPNHVCVPAQCNDQALNGTETDIDCGGLACPGCANGKVCAGNGDCLGGNCVASVCEPPSCAGGGAGLSDCGPGANESCCTSLPLPGGMYYRSYDGVSAGFTAQTYPATVSGFHLDKYEITVARFRKFVTAWAGGWRPAAGAGKHAHLNGGSGLAANGGGNEAGWDTSWENDLATTASTWNDTSHLACGAPAYQTWTASAGGTENRPVNCVNWYEAYAFCIWDGGFLPSEAEWNYAAAGGAEQRVYPWSSPANATTIDCSYASYKNCSATHTTNVGAESPKGSGKWGQADLAANVWEWNLDRSNPYAPSCTDCADFGISTSRVVRGGGFDDFAPHTLASYRVGNPPETRDNYTGARCGRMP